MTVKLEIPMTFNEFGWRALEERATAEGLELERLVSLACTHYESELAAERAATVAPGFRMAVVGVGETRTLEVEVSDICLRRLEQAAEHQEVGFERLCEHAALLYLADLDAGRVAERIVRRADPEANGSPSRDRPAGGNPA
jgi:hypothetical protein